MREAALRTAVGAAEGEDVAARFTTLYRELFPPLYGYVRFRVGDRHAAEDLTAQVFERALSRLAGVRRPEAVRAWLFAIARNAITDHRRAHRAVADLGVVEELEHLWVGSPEAEAVRRAEGRCLAAYLAELSERERELVGLRFAAGLPNREAARVLGLSEANAAQIVHRAVAKLRRRFSEEDAE